MTSHRSSATRIALEAQPGEQQVRRSVVILAAAAAAQAFITGGAVAQQAALPAAAAPSETFAADMSLPSAEQRMTEQASLIAPHVHLFQAPATTDPSPLANEVLVEQTDGLVLIDAGKTRGAGKRIVALIRSISPKPVKAVIITHWHQDHVMGLGPIIEAWPKAIVVSSLITRDHILNDPGYRGAPRTPSETQARDKSRADAMRQYAKDLGPNIRDPKLSAEEQRGWANLVGVLDRRIVDEQGTYLVVPGVTFTDHYRIDDPVSPVEARFIGPAHTDGDIVVWMPKQRVVAAGDMVVSPIPYSGDDVLAWPTTLANLKGLHPAFIVPGHGLLQTDETFVDKMIAGLVEMRTKAEALVAGPALSDEQVQAKVDLTDQKRIFAGDSPWLGYWFDQYFAGGAAKAYQQLRQREAPTAPKS
jgi:glyoxylase-like metal-dependent hydrolase (beta-lactamase superfamily II)